MKDIIIITEGTCGSACSMFVTKFQRYGRAVVVSHGGLPGVDVQLRLFINKHPCVERVSIQSDCIFQMDSSSFGGGNVEDWPNFVQSLNAFNYSNKPAPLPTSACKIVFNLMIFLCDFQKNIFHWNFVCVQLRDSLSFSSIWEEMRILHVNGINFQLITIFFGGMRVECIPFNFQFLFVFKFTFSDNLIDWIGLDWCQFSMTTLNQVTECKLWRLCTKVLWPQFGVMYEYDKIKSVLFLRISYLTFLWFSHFQPPPPGNVERNKKKENWIVRFKNTIFWIISLFVLFDSENPTNTDLLLIALIVVIAVGGALILALLIIVIAQRVAFNKRRYAYEPLPETS